MKNHQDQLQTVGQPRPMKTKNPETASLLEREFQAIMRIKPSAAAKSGDCAWNG